MKTYGQLAYEAYCAKQGWKNFKDEALPAWDELTREDIKLAWETSATFVIRAAERNAGKHYQAG